MTTAVAAIDYTEDEDVADQGTAPRHDKTGDKVGIGHDARVNNIHPEGAEAENPDHGIDCAEDWITKGLHRLCEDRDRRTDELELKHDTGSHQSVFNCDRIVQEELEPHRCGQSQQGATDESQ